MLKKLCPFLFCHFILAVFLSQTANAQSGGAAVTEGIRIFGLAYFDDFDPVSAMDLVLRMPGFNPREQSEGRGLSGVRSNMLINGERQPPKGKNAWQRLSDMPYTNVERIELIDAGSSDVDMQGYSQVVNVILKEDMDNFYELNTRYVKTGTGKNEERNQRDVHANMSALIYIGEHEISLRGGGRDQTSREPGNIVAIDPANPEQRISSLNQWDQDEQFIEAGSVFRLSDDRSLTVNAQRFDNSWASMPVTLEHDGTQDAVIESSDSEDTWQEISGEYRQPFGDNGELMVAVLDSTSNDTSESSLVFEDVNRSSLRNRESGETAARVRVTQRLTDSLTVHTTASTAYNYFEGDFQIFEDGVLLPLDGTDSRVEEDRYALEMDADWSFMENWIASGALTAGTYAIDTRELSTGTRFESKGYASLAWQPQDRTTITLETKRTIGQLSFGQYLASSNLSSEILQAGAGNLEPERQWIHSLNYDRRFGDRGVVRLNLSHRNVENPVRTVALDDSLTVSQNTSPEKINRLEASMEYPFTDFDFENIILEIDVSVSDSEVVDPISGETRDVSWVPPWDWSLGMRQLPGDGDWAWGVNISRDSSNDYYSVRSTRSESINQEWDAYVEWEFLQGFKLRGNIQGPRTVTRLTTFFPEVRKPGLVPSFYATTMNKTDRSSSLSLEWRKDNKLEIRAIYSPRPRYRTEEELLLYGETVGTTLAREIAESPRMDLRFRIAI